MAERVLLFVSALAGLGIIGHALPNGFGERPGMGWEGDYQDPKALGPGRGNSSYIADIASFIATQQVDVGGGRRATLQQLGYFYVNPSSSWDEFNRSASGQLVPNHLLYPHGIESTVDHIHVLGLSYGTYTDRGRLDCDKRPGELGHEKQDAEYFASIGVDWVKDDSCYDSGDEDTAIAHYAAFRDALNATGRKIWYALCGWEPWYASHTGGGNALANSARIGPDTGGGWTAVKKNIDNCKGIGQYAGAHNNGGYWNDGSLQLSPGVGCPAPRKCTSAQQCGGGATCTAGLCTGGSATSATCMTRARHQSQFSAWVVLGLNLVMTGNLPLIHAKDPTTLETWSNAEAIWLNQDSKSWSEVRYGRRLDAGPNLVGAAYHAQSANAFGSRSGYVKAHVAECGGEPDLQVWKLTTHGGTVYNPTTKTYLAMAGCNPKDLIYDGCSFNPSAVTCAGKGNYSHFGFTLETSGQVKAHYGANLCLTVSPDNTVAATPCKAGDSAQIWHASSTGQLQNGAHCLTDGTGPPSTHRNATAVYGRPLSSKASPSAGAYAVLLLNDGDNRTEVRCNADCVGKMSLPASFPATAFVRDIWAHKAIEPLHAVRQGFSMSVDGNGASRLVKLCATAAECASAVLPVNV